MPDAKTPAELFDDFIKLEFAVCFDLCTESLGLDATLEAALEQLRRAQSIPLPGRMPHRAAA